MFEKKANTWVTNRKDLEVSVLQSGAPQAEGKFFGVPSETQQAARVRGVKGEDRLY